MKALIVGECRTPIGIFLGDLSSLTSPQLGAAVIRESVGQAEIAQIGIDEVIMGNVLSARLGQALGAFLRIAQCNAMPSPMAGIE